ncbi:MAG: DUF1801 domain-containing protein [Planctomyces sp.]|nr:DUF1801 domain-containing protein [Planctomyces sp.]
MSASRQIDQRIRELGDWRGEMLARVRRLILDADARIVEECKWRGTPVWSCAGIICTGEIYKQVVKLTFARGAALPDPGRLFNSSLEGGTRRAIDIRQGELPDGQAFQSLIRAAIAENERVGAAKSKSARSSARSGSTGKATREAPVQPGAVKLLSGGNPQIAKGDGKAPVEAYIAAMPGWKSDLGRRLDALILRTVPEARQAVRWNSPFYGVEGRGWFVSFHVLTKYVKVTFFNGLSLKPIPPGGTERSGESRWIDIYEADGLDEARMADWIRQSAALPGWIP